MMMAVMMTTAPTAPPMMAATMIPSSLDSSVVPSTPPPELFVPSPVGLAFCLGAEKNKNRLTKILIQQRNRWVENHEKPSFLSASPLPSPFPSLSPSACLCLNWYMQLFNHLFTWVFASLVGHDWLMDAAGQLIRYLQWAAAVDCSVCLWMYRILAEIFKPCSKHLPVQWTGKIKIDT